MKQKIENCRALQEEMNSLVDTTWKKAGYLFNRAAWLEMTEALSVLDWKWWKKQTPDQYQLKLEMVDILHFMLSDSIIRNQSSASIRDAWEYARNRFNPINHTAKSAFAHGELFILDAINGDLRWMHFFNTMLALEIEFDEVLGMYLQKNVLNIFRQKRGYKEGTYIKEWFGAEDNKTLERIVTENPSFSSHEIYNALELAYSEVLSNHFNN